jgi:hypothetical protein
MKTRSEAFSPRSPPDASAGHPVHQRAEKREHRDLGDRRDQGHDSVVTSSPFTGARKWRKTPISSRGGCTTGAGPSGSIHVLKPAVSEETVSTVPRPNLLHSDSRAPTRGGHRAGSKGERVAI